MTRFLIFVMVMFCITCTADAVDVQQQLKEQLDVDILEQSLLPQEQQLLNGLSPEDSRGFLQQLWQMVRQVLKDGFGFWKDTMGLMARILLITVLCQLIRSGASDKAAGICAMTGGFAVFGCCLSDLTVLIGLGRDTVQRLTEYSALLVPVMASATAAAGSAARAGMTYALTVLFSNMMLQLTNAVCVPALYAYSGLALADCVLQQDKLKRLREFLKWLLELLLKALAYGFTAIVSVTGVLSCSADAVAVKGVKSAVSAMVPVVGGIISGAAESVWMGAVLLKNTIGIFGLLALLSMFLLPFVKLGISWILFRAVSALSGILGSQLSGLLEALSHTMGLLLAVIGCCSWIAMFACVCFLKVIQL